MALHNKTWHRCLRPEPKIRYTLAISLSCSPRNGKHTRHALSPVSHNQNNIAFDILFWGWAYLAHRIAQRLIRIRGVLKRYTFDLILQLYRIRGSDDLMEWNCYVFSIISYLGMESLVLLGCDRASRITHVDQNRIFNFFSCCNWQCCILLYFLYISKYLDITWHLIKIHMFTDFIFVKLKIKLGRSCLAALLNQTW